MTENSTQKSEGVRPRQAIRSDRMFAIEKAIEVLSIGNRGAKNTKETGDSLIEVATKMDNFINHKYQDTTKQEKN